VYHRHWWWRYTAIASHERAACVLAAEAKSVERAGNCRHQINPKTALFIYERKRPSAVPVQCKKGDGMVESAMLRAGCRCWVDNACGNVCRGRCYIYRRSCTSAACRLMEQKFCSTTRAECGCRSAWARGFEACNGKYVTPFKPFETTAWLVSPNVENGYRSARYFLYPKPLSFGLVLGGLSNLDNGKKRASVCVVLLKKTTVLSTESVTRQSLCNPAVTTWKRGKKPVPQQ